jgi:hypothetical protein
MNTNHLDAQALAQPGGLYPSVNNALLQGLMAYFQHRDRQSQEQRQLQRDERTLGRDQLRDALANAERYGVRPGSTEAGWIPQGQEGLVDAAVRNHSVRQAQEAQQRQAQEIAQRAALLKVAREQGPGAFAPGQFTGDMATAWSEGQKERGADQRVAALREAILSAQATGAKNEATWNNPLMRTMRGVGNFASEAVQEAIKAGGRQKAEKPQGWRVNEDMSQSRQLEDGSTVFRKPDGTVYIVDPMGKQMPVEEYQRRSGAPTAGPVASAVGGPAAGGEKSIDGFPVKEWQFQGDLIKKAITDGKTIGGSRRWNKDGSPILSQAEIDYTKTLPAQEQANLTKALAASDYSIRAIASARLAKDAAARK